MKLILLCSFFLLHRLVTCGMMTIVEGDIDRNWGETKFSSWCGNEGICIAGIHDEDHEEREDRIIFQYPFFKSFQYDGRLLKVVIYADDQCSTFLPFNRTEYNCDMNHLCYDFVCDVPTPPPNCEMDCETQCQTDYQYFYDSCVSFSEIDDGPGERYEGSDNLVLFNDRCELNCEKFETIYHEFENCTGVEITRSCDYNGLPDGETCAFGMSQVVSETSTGPPGPEGPPGVC